MMPLFELLKRDAFVSSVSHSLRDEDNIERIARLLVHFVFGFFFAPFVLTKKVIVLFSAVKKSFKDREHIEHAYKLTVTFVLDFFFAPVMLIKKIFGGEKP